MWFASEMASPRRNGWTRTGKAHWMGTRNSRKKNGGRRRNDRGRWTVPQIDCGKKMEKELKRRDGEEGNNWQTRNRTIKLRTKRKQRARTISLLVRTPPTSFVILFHFLPRTQASLVSRRSIFSKYAPPAPNTLV